jgi:putative transposase
MHDALLFIAATIARAHDRCLLRLARRHQAGELVSLQERVARLEAENAILRARFLRVPARRRPHYRRHERMDILWHAARYGISVERTAATFLVTRETVLNWRAVTRRKSPHLLPPLRGLSALVEDLVHRLKAEWPRWGTRRIAGQLARLGVRASRSSVQRILRRPREPRPEDRLLPRNHAGLLARRPYHMWMIDFTRVGGIVRPLWVGAVIDAFSRKVLAIGCVRGGPGAAFAVRLLRRALRCHAAPTWLVSDKDTALRNQLVNTLLLRHGIRRRYGAVGKKGSIAIIERLWRSMKQEYVRHLFLYRTVRAIDVRAHRWARWYNAERPHQGLGQRTPDEVYRRRPPRRTRDLTGGALHVGFLEGDRHLPVLRLRRAG